MTQFFHQIAMWSIFLGGLILFYLAFVWFGRNNTIMGSGMAVMGIVALSNFYLHQRIMRKNGNRR